MRVLHNLPGLLALALLAAIPGAASAQTATYLYAFNQRGMVSANAYALDNLPDGSVADDEQWWDIFVQGADRWLIRGDGKIAKNGEVIDDLAEDDNWRSIVVDDSGTFFALRNGGRVSNPSGIVVDYSGGDFLFLDMVIDANVVYVLKTNGAVFRVPETDPIIKFNGPPGEISGNTDDGEAADTLWATLLVNPADGRMWALRRDGVIKSADIPPTPPVTPDGGTLETELPYDDGDDFIDQDELYRDFAFDADGTWYALRADGRLFNATAQGPPLVDFPGEPSDDGDETYVSVLAREGQTLVLREDGKVFRDLNTTAVTDLKSDEYLGLAIGDTFPDLTNVENQPPTATATTIVAPEGANVVLPVLATDRDKESVDLVVDVETDTLPAGATWDGVARTISWPAAGPVGTYKVKVTVDDGIAKLVTVKQTITIKPLDANANKNIKPYIAKVAKAVALVAIPLELQVIAWDRDGDTLDLSLDDSGSALPEGTSFDDVSGILTWDDPLIADKGTQPFKFLAEDGTAVGKRTIKVKVETSLLAF